jgi:hypothetical protein
VPQAGPPPGHRSGSRRLTAGVDNCKGVDYSQPVPKFYVGPREWQKAVYATRWLHSPGRAGENLRISRQAVHQSVEAANGRLLMWVYGREGKALREYEEVYIDFGWDSGPEDAYQWQGSEPEDLVGGAIERYRRAARGDDEEEGQN